MCGIAGIVRLDAAAAAPSPDEIARMVGALRHRGPDGFGLYRDGRVGLGHARLAIIDLETGDQPLANATDDLWIVFNGEIFNYLELRAELVAAGHRFRTKGDTEVIVHAFEAWGEQAFERMNGQFAFALWDQRRRRLTLVRDRLGVRPLHYAEHAGRLYFASEVKSLFAAAADLPRRLDPIGLDQTFTFWTVVSPRTVFEGVRELPPGHVRSYDLAGDTPVVTERAWYEPAFPEVNTNGGADAGRAFAGSVDDAAGEVRRALEQATALRMLRSDVPVGSYLSGGLDSTLVASLALAAKGERFHTFSLRFEDAEYDETSYQRMAVERLGSEHHEVVVSRRDIADAFPAVVAATERPILRTAPAPLFLLSGLVQRAGIKVVLTGEGADELFAGYDLFREAKVRRFWARRPDSRLRPRLLERLYPYLARSPVANQAMARQFFGRNLGRATEPGFGHEPRWHTTGALKRLLGGDMQQALAGQDAAGDLLATLPEAFPRWSFLSQDQYLEIRTLLSGYLLSSQGDRMLMAHSVEGRFPFLDRDVAALANRLPSDYKLRVLDEKHVLKRAARDLIPPEILARPKQPYRAPDALSFVGDGKGGQTPGWVDELLDESAVRAGGVFDPPAVRALAQKCRERAPKGQLSNSDNMAMVGVLSTQLLHHQFVARRPDAGAPVSFRTAVER
ncbi:MAG TPA: asparagine synthase (glutamine-hydrolyzing) [Polyangia bacterium]|nr:asparagine synthase (glutamine-hydrolyzing) [Polyangia bacterium]